MARPKRKTSSPPTSSGSDNNNNNTKTTEPGLGSSSSSGSAKKKTKRAKTVRKPEVKEETEDLDLVGGDSDQESPVGEPVGVDGDRASPVRRKGVVKKKKEEVEGVKDEEWVESRFLGEPVADAEARQKWPSRYTGIIETDPTKQITQAKRHFKEALIDGRVHFKLGDDGFVYAGEDIDNYICRVVELFEGVDGKSYFRAQWFYRAKDTIIQACSNLIDEKRIFLSEVKDDNPLDCLVEKLNIVRVPLDLDVASKTAMLADGNYYYDMSYLVPFSSYKMLPPDKDTPDGHESDSTISSESEANVSENKTSKNKEENKSVMRLLDLYSGCGGMSTGLCLGANMAGVNLITRWAVDFNKNAIESLKLNHPETEARFETAEDFLILLKEWKKLCQSCSLIDGGEPAPLEIKEDDEEEDDDDDEGAPDGQEIFEVEKILAICYGDPNKIKTRGLYLKIRWKNYGPEEDTWEPYEGLGNCEEKIKQFVVDGFNAKILPLPGDADVICGGPPCQGISGFNRFRNTKSPLDDEKNQQLVVYMDIVEYLKPRFCLMENVVDIVKFAKGFLGRYALGRLVSMNYQARVGLMKAGGYGLPQFRMRMFMWGARPGENLPQYPLPTHNVVKRGVTPLEFDSNNVDYDIKEAVELETELYLGDAISDLPPVTNDESRDKIPYGDMPTTDFQRFIRLKKKDMPGFVGEDNSDHPLYDHRPYKCNTDDYQRICHIPKRKGANFRDMEGVRVRDDNKVEFDPAIKRVLLPSGKPLVPDYAMSFVDGRSAKPFRRLWWDETVPTVVTRAEPHNQAIIHPIQDRVLTVRENARLQGFPDYYKFFGPIKERYMQVGNAVAVPVGRALGYSLARSVKGTVTEGPVFTLPKKFPNLEAVETPLAVEGDQ